MGDAPTAFLDRHVQTFNAAVRSGNFSPLVALFAEDATLEFVGVPAGPFHGREAISAGYAAHPPTDTLTVLAVRAETRGRPANADSRPQRNAAGSKRSLAASPSVGTGVG
jgi:hypothetical protein